MSIQTKTEPELSVVIVAPDQYATIRRTIRHLRAQTITDRLEILVVTPSAKQVQVDDPELKDLAPIPKV